MEEIILEKNVLMILRPGEEWISTEQAKTGTPNGLLSYVDADKTLNEQSSLQYSFDLPVLPDLDDFPSTSFSVVELPQTPSTLPKEIFLATTPGPFSILWENVPNEIHEHMINNESLPSQKYAQFVQYIVERVREHDKYTKKKGFETIAKEIVEKYPITFKDIDEDGQLIGEGLMRRANENDQQKRVSKSAF